MRRLRCASQFLAFEDDWQIDAKLRAPTPERYWRLAPLPDGWEQLSQQA